MATMHDASSDGSDRGGVGSGVAHRDKLAAAVSAAEAAVPGRRTPRRFRPRLLPTAGMVLVVAVTIALGNWQRSRGEYKSALAADYRKAAAASALDLDAASASRIGALPVAELRYRSVRVSGSFAPEAQMLLDNRVHAGRPGYAVITPLRFAGSGSGVLVDRGWVPIGRDRGSPPSPPAPAGEIKLTGRIDLPPSGPHASHPPEGRIWQRIDIDAMSKASGFALLPIVVEQTSSAAPDDRLERARKAPDFGIDTHRVYMVQWYSLAALAIGLWLGLNWRRDDGHALG